MNYKLVVFTLNVYQSNSHIFKLISCQSPNQSTHPAFRCYELVNFVFK